MRDQIIVREITALPSRSGEYRIQFVKPAAATVDLIAWTNFSTEAMYLTTRGYTGVYSPNLQWEGYTKEQAFSDIAKTKLQTPLEMVHMLWLFRDVTRAFTHQLVRYRVGTAFVQESMRFFGMHGVFKVLITGEASAYRKDGYETGNIDEYEHGVVQAIKSYVKMIDRGVPSEDARGVLPTNILTNIFFDCSLRTLSSILPQRLCCQAQQGEWQPILREMRKLISINMGDEIEQLLRAPYELGQDCGYRASFDRPCVWKKNNESANVRKGQGLQNG